MPKSIKIPDELHAALKKQAAAEDRTIGAVIKRALHIYMTWQREEGEGPA